MAIMPVLGGLRIARGGLPYVAGVAALALWAHSVTQDSLALGLWGCAGLLWWLYRDPERQVPPQPLAIVSPVDGVVRASEDGPDPYRGVAARRVEIALRWWSVRALRCPMEGRVREVWYGARLRPDGRDRSGFSVWIESDEGDSVVLVVGASAGFRARALITVGMRIGQGQRCGIVPLGARVAVYADHPVRAEVAAGTQVRAGSDVIARIVHNAPTATAIH